MDVAKALYEKKISTVRCWGRIARMFMFLCLPLF